MRVGKLLLVGLVGLALLVGCAPAATVRVPSTGPSSYGGAELDVPYQLPDLSLIDTNGKEFAVRTGSDRPVLVFFFGYTNCPDICLEVLTDLASAVNRLPEDVRNRMQVVFVTVDPHRDTPEAMAKYLARIDPGFVGLTGDPKRIEQLAVSMGVAIEGIEGHHEGAYDVTHSTQVVGFDAQRRGVIVWTQGTSIGTFRADFERLVRQQG
ncbi:MAG: SCO family protein [Propionicimonas sp.]